MNSDIRSTLHDFSERSYIALLETLSQRGFSFVGFDHKGGPNEPQIILRHDVDIDLQSAVRLAEIEAELQISSTYFILCSSEFYNINSLIGRTAVRRLAELGHQLGVHFDPSVYDVIGTSGYDRQLLREQQLLEDICGVGLSVFSLHKPGANVDSLRSIETGMLNAYQDAFFKDIGYVSDSMGWWRFGHPVEQPFFVHRTKAQIVTHPIWWTSEQGEHPSSRLARFLSEVQERADRSLSVTVAPYGAWLSRDKGAKWTWSEDVRSGAAWSDPRLTDTYCEATCGRLGRSPDASSTSSGVPSTRGRAGPVA